MKQDDIDLILEWVQRLQKKVFLEGKSLSNDLIPIAKQAGLENIENVKVLSVDNILLPELDSIATLQKLNGLISSQAAGLTLGYAILLKKSSSTHVLIHELRHVAQFELFNSLRDFVIFYIKEIEKFGYGDGPLEKDAIDFLKCLKI